ncbi:MAG: alanine-tRNA synthetase second additional domain-containing protein, partial [Firmicutes bacterium]|nr:alanine-tRNA synthetase second additional domain-containing protein [Bacillota bacterium]
PVSFYDEDHIKIADVVHPCTGPRIHVRSTGEIENFRLLKEIFYDSIQDMYLIIGQVGETLDREIRDLNRIKF